MNIFENAVFHDTVNHMKDLPDLKAEIAFVGRSNSGKSSCINTLTRQKRLAYVSKTPGRTQFINYFELPSGLFLVDLPGYGYAEVPEKMREHWMELLGGYIETREPLKGIFVIMDIRRPFTKLDLQMIEFVRHRDVKIHLILTKADKFSRNEEMRALAQTRKMMKELGIAERCTCQSFSSLKRKGVDEVSEVVMSWLPEFFGKDEANGGGAGGSDEGGTPSADSGPQDSQGSSESS